MTKRCVPQNITELIDVAQKNHVDLDKTDLNSTVLEQLPNAIFKIKSFAELEKVSSESSPTDSLPE